MKMKTKLNPISKSTFYCLTEYDIRLKVESDKLLFIAKFYTKIYRKIVKIFYPAQG